MTGPEDMVDEFWARWEAASEFERPKLLETTILKQMIDKDQFRLLNSFFEDLYNYVRGGIPAE